MATTARFTPGAGQDNTLRTVTQDIQQPAYAATLVVFTNAQYTLFNPAQLAGALALSVNTGSATTPPYVGDVLDCLFTSTPGSTITLGAGFLVTAATVVIPAGKGASISFIWNGAAYAEQRRAITI